MNRRSLLQGGICSLALGDAAQPNEATRETILHEELARILQLVHQIRPGDLRRSLSKDWKEDGGLQVSSPTRYLLRDCNTLQISVDFRQVDVTRPFDNPDDIITHVSRPYLSYPAYD